MNKNDSELMAISLTNAGFTETKDQDEAGIVAFNTCSVRKNAEDRAVARLREARGRQKEAIVIAAGCLSQHIGSRLVADGICHIAIGPYQSPNVGEIVKAYKKDPSQQIFVSSQQKDFAGRLHPALIHTTENDFWHRWVTITHGCENFCSYCIVPHVRGKLISFPSKSILDFIRKLPENGVSEITLLGQNVNQYGQDLDDLPFYKLLDECAKIEGLRKIGFLTSHPKDFSSELIDVIAQNANIARSIHLPLQSGSDTVLKRMNRGYSSSRYLSIINEIREKLPEVTITTDLIVGFPGETEEEFEQTLAMVREIGYDDAYMYAYSPREGTLSASFTESLTGEEKTARLSRLIDVQREITALKLQKHVGTKQRMTIERVSKRNSAEVSGRTFSDRQMVIPGSAEEIGKMVNVKVTKVNGATLYGCKI